MVAPIDPLSPLTAREREVLLLIVAGRSSKEVARALGLQPGSVHTYRSRIMAKLGIKTLAGLVRFAVRHGLTPLE
jgi:DNA-binding CsgD family transcriptional regulator